MIGKRGYTTSGVASSNRTFERIRLRIELPMMDYDDGQGSTGDSFEELHDSCSSSSASSTIQEPVYVNNAEMTRSRLALKSPQTPPIRKYTGGGTICVDINIDTSGKRKQLRRSPSTISSASKSSVIKSLRYPASTKTSSSCHSSSSSSSGYSSPSKTELTYNLTDLETSALTRQPIGHSAEVIYDKLNYISKGRSTPVVDLSRRKSVVMTTGTYEAISDFSQLNEKTAPIYEEISHFDQSRARDQLLTAAKETTCYEQLSSMKESTVKIKHRSIYKREYTLNEIFQNIKSFKRQAKEQEMIQVRRPPPPPFTDHIYVNQHISDSVNV